MDGFVAVPEWTEVQQKSGLDPLGFQAASVRLYQELVPGISNVTLRTRYYGFYPWLSRHYAAEVGDTDSEAWKKTVRRAEALYALAAAKKETDGEREPGVSGLRWARRKFADMGRKATIDFAAHADPDGEEKPYLQQSWGAFGAAYESQLVETGVLGNAETHDTRVPTDEIGDVLADEFERAAADAAAKFLRTVKAGSVSLNALGDFSRMLPSAIHPQGNERSAYERMLFAEIEKPTDRDVARRKTLILALRIAERVESEPTPEDVRWILYAGADRDGEPFEIPEAQLSDHRRRWWAYHAGDLGRTAYEAFLKWLLDVLEDHPVGLGAGQLADAAVDALELDDAGWPNTWRRLVADLPAARNVLSEDEPTSELALSEEVMTAGTGAERAPLRSAQAAVELLAVLFRRCNPERAFLAKQHALGRAGDAARSLPVELAFLEAQQDVPLRDLLRRVFRERVLDRHLWVAMRKLQYQRDYTFLVENEDGRMRLRAKDGPVFTNPRLAPMLTFLKDIHLVDGDGLTSRGQRLVRAA
jgi:hypothetical protein